MFSGWVFLYLYYSYTYPHTTILSVHAWIIYVGIIGFFDQSVKISTQNPQTLRAIHLICYCQCHTLRLLIPMDLI